MSKNLSSPESVPAPAPRKPKTGLIIGIVAGVLVLCLGGAAIIAGIYFGRDQIAGHFASSTPQGTYYNSASMNLSLYYPPTWTYQEQGATVTFATSQEMLNATTYPSTGAWIMFVRDSSFLSLLAPDIDPSSPEAILGQIMGPRNPLGVIGGIGTELEPLRSFSVGGNPAASVVYSYGVDLETDLLRYTIVIIPQDMPITIFALCPQSEWAIHRPNFDAMIASLDIGPMP
jgi:hypothetical protein